MFILISIFAERKKPMDSINNEAAYSNPVLEMLKVTNEYCLFLESINKYSLEDTYILLHRMLPLLYLKGSLLPEIEVEDIGANERFVTAEQWESLFTDLRKRFEGVDEFWYLDYNSADATNPIKGSISEQLADIYQDLKDFLILYQKNSKDAKQNAANDCRVFFYTHWGAMSINLQKQIHHLLYKDLGFEEEIDIF